MGCSKSLDFVVAQPAPFAYYKMEEADGNAVDSISAYNFVNTGQPAQIVPGKINNAYDLADHGAGGVFCQTPLSNLADFSTIDFTIRIWVKQNVPFFGDLFVAETASLFDNWDITNGVDGKIRLLDPSSQVFVTPDLNDGNWHRVIFLRQRAGYGWGMKVDNGVTTFSVGGGTPMVTDQTHWIFKGFLGIILDEVSIWKGLVLTESQMLFDWNGGAGITWPW